jgi:hypothetical protein
VLYIPRGWIHQAECTAKISVHATISTNQSNTLADELEILIPNMLQDFINQSANLRFNLPTLTSLSRQTSREAQIRNLQNATQAFFEDGLAKASLDPPNGLFPYASDTLGARFMLQRLPPPYEHIRRYHPQRVIEKSRAGDWGPEYPSVYDSIIRGEKGWGFSVSLPNCYRLVAGEHLIVYHPFDNERDGSHYAVGVQELLSMTPTSSTGDAPKKGQLIIPNDLEMFAIELFDASSACDDPIVHDVERFVNDFVQMFDEECIRIAAEGLNDLPPQTRRCLDGSHDVRAYRELIALGVRSNIFVAYSPEAKHDHDFAPRASEERRANAVRVPRGGGGGGEDTRSARDHRRAGKNKRKNI